MITLQYGVEYIVINILQSVWNTLSSDIRTMTFTISINIIWLSFLQWNTEISGRRNWTDCNHFLFFDFRETNSNNIAKRTRRSVHQKEDIGITNYLRETSGEQIKRINFKTMLYMNCWNLILEQVAYTNIEWDLFLLTDVYFLCSTCFKQ